jgi:competence protein ComEC
MGDAANSSVAYLLTVNGARALFTGDIEPDVATDVAAELVDDGLDEPVDIFLATHHGSKYGSVIDLLSVIEPRWVVLSTGPNGFHHPAASTIERLKATGASIWCTAVNGTVTARIGGSGTLTWRASAQVAPWWSAESRKETGICVDQ